MNDIKETMPSVILVTGASGFIGRRLVSVLKRAGTKVYPFSTSNGQEIRDPSCFNSFKHQNITHVIHLAGRTFVPESWRIPGEFYGVNTLGTQHVLDFCRECSARLIYISAYIYGIPQVLPISEFHHASPNNPYAHSKWLGEELCRFYAQEFDVPVTILRPFNLFGPGQAAQFLIPTILQQARTTSLITIKDAAPRRDYLHIDDFVKACVKVLQLDTRFSVFNVGSGYSVSVGELLDMVVKFSPRPLGWKSTEEPRANEIPDTVADISAIQSTLKWKPKISLEDFVKAELA